MLIDSHCHLDDEQFAGDRDAAIARAIEAGVGRMVVIGTGGGPPDLEAGIRMAEAHEPVLATVGVHPQHAHRATDGEYSRLRDLITHPKVIAVGEIGFDYYWQPVHKQEQRAWFVRQLELAREFRKPVSIHTRDAWDDAFSVLETHWDGHDLPCVLHCFSGGPAVAERALANGYYLSFAGVVTFPKATELQQSAKLAPLDRILVETDAPYLAPSPRRGKRNEPAYVRYTAQKIAELRGVGFEVIEEATTSNFQRAFGPT